MTLPESHGLTSISMTRGTSITACIVVAVVAAILAIWEFTKTDVLWRTVATCVVIAAGTSLFAHVNGSFDDNDG